MKTNLSETKEIYQLRFYVLKISPMIWRRIHISSESTISDLHYLIQIALGWDDYYLHQFKIRGKRYGISKDGGVWFSDNPDTIRLDKFKFRLNEWFIYEYNFFDEWQVKIRFEKSQMLNPHRVYPFCIGGARAAPPEDCGGPWAFMGLKQEHSPWRIMERITEVIEDSDQTRLRDVVEASEYWIKVDQFKRKKVNFQMKQYSRGVPFWELDCEEAEKCA